MELACESQANGSLLTPVCFLLSLSSPPKVWYDNRADNLTKDGMLEGIERAAAFILFLSVGVLTRPYCQLEVRHALALKKRVVLLHGTQRRVPLANWFLTARLCVC